MYLAIVRGVFLVPTVAGRLGRRHRYGGMVVQVVDDLQQCPFLMDLQQCPFSHATQRRRQCVSSSKNSWQACAALGIRMNTARGKPAILSSYGQYVVMAPWTHGVRLGRAMTGGRGRGSSLARRSNIKEMGPPHRLDV